MYLKALELQGFKSFPDKTSLSFGSGITAVVGPNGSGKSNISDAIRWVLGEQSSKTLRGSRMEDVIFGGTKIRKALGFAEVSLCLDNCDRSLDRCDKDEVRVTRRYYRSGESEYLMNGETVRLRDIHELFMDTGLGRDGYSIVSQGRVADMISSRSSQRREMLEEAAGISAFRYRRLDATRRLQQAEDNLSRLRDIMAELESRIGPLKTQSEKAQKFLVLAQDKKQLDIGLWLHTIEKAKLGIREQEHRLSLARSQYESAENELKSLELSIEQIISDAQAITIEIETIRQSASLLEEEAARVEGEIAVEKNTIDHNNATIERITRDLEQAADDEIQVDEQIDKALDEIDELTQEIQKLSETLAAAAADMSDVKEDNVTFAQQTAQLSQEISALTVKLSDRRIESNTASSSIEEIKARTANIDTVIQSRGGLLQDIQNEHEECVAELSAQREKATELQNFVAGHQLRSNSRKKASDALKTEIDNINLDLHQKLARAKMLDELEKNMEGYSGSVRNIITQSKRGSLRGIHGTIAQLINVEEKYAVAVETAFGASVQDIITDNENDAKRAISYLKENRAGRATFLPISAVRSKPFTHTGLDGCDGFVGMADTLLTYDKQYDEIMKFQLSHTAVCEDMDTAIAMARKFGYRFKIVTLDGQVINAGGSMTGGSRGHNSGILSRANEIEKLREQASQLQKDVDKKLEEQKLLLEELALVDADLSGAAADLARAQETVIRKEGELKLIDGRFESVSTALDELRREKENNAVRIAQLSDTVKAAEVDVIELTSKIDEIQDKLGVLGKSREELDARREEIAQLETKTNLDILSLQKDIDARSQAISSYRAAKEQSGDRLEMLNKEISDIAQSSRETAENIRTMQERVLSLRSDSASSKDRVSVLVQRRTDLEAQSAAMRGSERSKNETKESLSGELARLEERRSAMENELESSRSKLYDEYQLTQREAEELGIVIDDPAAAHREVQDIKNKIRALGSVNVGAIEEYKEVSERWEYLSVQLNDVECSKEELLKLIGELTAKMSEQFREQFIKINSFFSETFAELFDGGKAELVLENPLDVLECNVDLKVQPPGKNVQNIDLLSGGEKGLSAIALLFAILKVSPAPFCVFDEVEAALDDVNVVRYAQYVRRMTRNTQFILITHRRGTMEEADTLYGVTMQEEGVSKLLELKTAEMAKRLGVG